jgi:alkaline phosphatase D
MSDSIENVAILTGDIHTSWGNDIPIQGASYNPATGAGSAFVEFVAPSISTGSSVSNSLLPLIEFTNPHMKYVDLTKYGYLVLDIDTGRVQGDWYHLSTLQSTSYTVTRAASWYEKNHERFLRQASAAAPAFTNPAPFAPVPLDTTTGVVTAGDLLKGFNVYPNPFANELTVNYTALRKGNVQISIRELTGKEVLQKNAGEVSPGTYTSNFNTSLLPKGIYLVKIYSDSKLGGITKMVKN